MNFSKYTFIALDLETTGLNPNTDTIIEIAAIRFTLEREGNIFVMQNSEERTMLINPGRTLEQEITMITGISDEMLIGKPTFESVCNKIGDFIGDSIILGHNVLFDIAMLTSHGIDLSSNTVIDTFELSEIFSQDIESLNLGFLANHYGLIDTNETEHRALTDTKVSIRLFMRYLGNIYSLTGKKKQIWDKLISKDESQTMKVLAHICNLVPNIEGDISMIFGDLLGNSERVVSNKNISAGINKNLDNKILIDTHGDIQQEINIIKNIFKSHSLINLIVPGYKVAKWISSILRQYNIENMIAIPTKKWCSISYLMELILNKEIYPRKKIILILKLAFWMTDTKTGLIDELKYYGDERNLILFFHSSEQDSLIWRDQYEEKIKKVPVLITDAYNLKIENQEVYRFTVIKDITLLEDIVRRIESQEISFDRLYESIRTLNCEDITIIEERIHMTDMVSMIREIYESIPNRPTGPLALPPGTYGETYFITQQMLWQKGYKWLIHATNSLDQSWKKWKEGQKISLSQEEKISIEYIDSAIYTLFQYHIFTENNKNIILNILDKKTKILFIPRSVKSSMLPFLSESIGYGANISLPQTETFLKNEYGYSNHEFNCHDIHEIPKATSTHITKYVQYHPGIIQSGTVILTTSQKHARDIGKELRKIHGKNIVVLIQGLSGGKGKMLATFNNNIEQTILVGIIDTWRDEYELWANARHIIIAKLPFDPPTDSYFLARTVGMKNNFSEYSEPIVIIRLNTLIERVISSGYTSKIVITDSRLIDTEWGKRIYNELL